MEKRIFNEDDRELIKFEHEKIAAKFLIDMFPHAFLYYERRNYEIKEFNEELNKEVVIASTQPDFELEDSESDTLLAVVEVTTSNKHDAKARQKNVMKKTLPNVPYIILYGIDINIIEKRQNIDGVEIFKRTKNLNKLGKIHKISNFAAD